VTGTTVNSGGEQNIYASGTASGTTLNAGSAQVDWGTATNTTINGGNQFVYGAANGTTISSGVQYVQAGGTASGTTIDSGGTEHVFTGGAAHDVTFGGPSATLALDQTSTAFTGTISGFQSGDRIDLGDILFQKSGATLATLGYTENAANTGGTLTVSDGSHVASLALLGQYTASSFALSSDGQFGTYVTDTAIAAQASIAAPHHA
jgi:autotransporter passenger strand-loop-strand repeat protein